MATAVLRPQDLLAERFHVHPTSFRRRRILTPSENLTNSVVVNRKQHRKISPPKPGKRRFSFPAAEGKISSRHHGGVSNPRRILEITSGGSTATGQVTLLRRGEPLSSIASPTVGGNPSDPIRKPVGNLLVPRRIFPVAGTTADVYAGSAFSMSPSPRSVPLPSFFNKKDSNDGATRNLRRLLRLK